MEKNMSPSIQEPNDKGKIHHMRNVLKIRTKTREENSWDSQIWTQSFHSNTRVSFTNGEEDSLLQWRSSCKEWNGQENGVNFIINQKLTPLNMISTS